jgi:hypothetical protein
MSVCGLPRFLLVSAFARFLVMRTSAMADAPFHWSQVMPSCVPATLKSCASGEVSKVGLMSGSLSSKDVPAERLDGVLAVYRWGTPSALRAIHIPDSDHQRANEDSQRCPSE